MEMVYRLVRGEEGVSLAEEALLIGLIAVVCVGVLTTFGLGVQGLYAGIIGAL